MPGLTIWKNQHINRLRRDMNRMFDRVCGEFGLSQTPLAFRGMPTVDLTETERDLILRAEIPGMDPEDLDIAIEDNILTIKGESRQEIIKDGENYHRTERRYGSFSRTFQLPCRVMINDVEASYKKGILKIVMPKCAPETMRTVKIKLK